MPSTAENIQQWNKDYHWEQDGDLWSDNWGSARAQWYGCLLPRIFPFLSGRILEIAPGHGRWTQFLQGHCSSLIGIDLSPACVDYCRERFKNQPKLTFQANDGYRLPMIESESIDFAFSFDSLVHAEADVLSSYVKELARVLKPGGAAFIHHSNLGAAVWGKLLGRVPRRPRFTHWRAYSMSAGKMRSFVEQCGMVCVRQEIVPWDMRWPLLIDCMSTIVNAAGEPSVVAPNRRFMKEAAAIKHISSIA